MVSQDTDIKRLKSLLELLEHFSFLRKIFVYNIPPKNIISKLLEKRIMSKIVRVE